MPRNRTEPVSVDEVRARFEEWRQNRQGRARIPDELWSAAIELACSDGLCAAPRRRKAETAHDAGPRTRR